jgi:serine/threonine-protein phosphatase 2B catalytic subunit
MSGVPSVITVFSAPNYCGSYNNKGAVLMLNNNAIKLKTFSDE